MVRPRDSKGRFLKTDFPENLFGGNKTPPINPAERYAGSSRREGSTSKVATPQSEQIVEKVQEEEGEFQDQPAKGPQVGKPDIDPTLEQTVNPEHIHKLLKTPHNVVISQVETSVVGGNRRLQIGDNFTLHQNPVSEPPLSPSPEEFSLFGHMADEEERNREPEGESTFGFPILDLMPNVNMKNIPPSVLPNFRGMVTEDPDAFLFEFDILCRSYNYVDDAQKLKLFPATLKDSCSKMVYGT
jgi:hypothetical protein